MSFTDWLFGKRPEKPSQRPPVQHLFSNEHLLGVLYADAQVRTWRPDGKAVHDQKVTGPRVLARGADLLDSIDDEGRFGLPFQVGRHRVRVGKGELRVDGAEVELPDFKPSAQLRIVGSADGRLALLDPFLNRAIVWQDGRITRVGERSLPVMGGAFVEDQLHLVREGRIERYAPDGALLGTDQPHGLQTLEVAPGASLGLDANDRLELRHGDAVHNLGRPPARTVLDTRRGVVAAVRDGFFVDGVTVPVPNDGVLDTDHGVWVASDPPALYGRDGRCIGVFG